VRSTVRVMCLPDELRFWIVHLALDSSFKENLLKAAYNFHDRAPLKETLGSTLSDMRARYSQL